MCILSIERFLLVYNSVDWYFEYVQRLSRFLQIFRARLSFILILACWSVQFIMLVGSACIHTDVCLHCLQTTKQRYLTMSQLTVIRRLSEHEPILAILEVASWSRPNHSC
jgi:hypothetical protein